MTQKSHVFGKWSVRLALFALIATWIAGCQSNKNALAPGKACTTQSQCECLSCPLKDLLICTDGACHRICNVDSDCAVGEACHAGVCQAKDIACTNKDDCPADTPCQTYACQDDFCQSDVLSEGTICVPESNCIINAACDNLGQCTGEIETCEPRESTCQETDGESFLVYYETNTERDPKTCQCSYTEKTIACPECDESTERKQFCINCLDMPCPTVPGTCQTNCACDPESVQCACDSGDSTTGDKIPCYLDDDTDNMSGVCIAGVCEVCLDDADCLDDKNCDNKNCESPIHCSGAGDCPDDGDFCNGDEYCDTDTWSCANEGTECDELCDEVNKVCYGCTSDVDCAEETPVCNTDTSSCVECWLDNTPCIDTTPFDCKQATCLNNTCVQDGAIISSTLSSSISCKQDEPCDTADDCSPLDDDDDDDDDDDGHTPEQEPASEHDTQTCHDGICTPGNGSTGYCALDDSGTCLECLSDTDCGEDTCDSCGVCGGLGMPTDCDDCDAAADIPDGQCDCTGSEPDVCGVCGGTGIPEGQCDCVGNTEDECGVCGGTGIPEGKCDCEGNVEDECGVCNGPCVDLLPDDCKNPDCTDNVCQIGIDTASNGTPCNPHETCNANTDCNSGICSNAANLWQELGFESSGAVEFTPYDVANYFPSDEGHAYICINVEPNENQSGYCKRLPVSGEEVNYPFCVECSQDSHCTQEGLEYCNDSGECVACTDGEHCQNLGALLCHNNTCVECYRDSDCVGNADRTICDNAQMVVGTTYTCVACTEDNHCIDNEQRPTCDTSHNTCNNCENATECSDAGLGNHCCQSGQCATTPCSQGGGPM